MTAANNNNDNNDNKMRMLAVIPARGGSKRIPHKNIKDFLGKPLIAYSIETALKSGIFTDVVVSTDDEEIAKVAKECGAQVPFMRSAELSNDFAGTGVVAYDAICQMRKLGHEYDGCCTIYATAPLLTVEHLTKAYNTFVTKHVDYMQSACEFPFPIQRGFYIKEDGTPYAIMPECQQMRSQDLPKSYQDAGQFYLKSARFCELEHNDPQCLVKPLPEGYVWRLYEMPRHRVIDIDTMDDWQYALVLAKAVQELNLS